jgi:hypothetical protein
MEFGQPIQWRAQQAQQPGGQPDLGAVERHQVHGPEHAGSAVRRAGGSRERLGGYLLRGHQLLQAAASQLSVDA